MQREESNRSPRRDASSSKSAQVGSKRDDETSSRTAGGCASTEEAELLENLISAIRDQTGVCFAAMQAGVTEALRGLTEPVVDEQKRQIGKTLALIAASAAVAGVAGTVGAIVGGYVADMLTGAQAAAVKDSSKQLVKTALHSGSAAPVASTAESLLTRFADLQYKKLFAARTTFNDLLRDVLVPRLRRLSGARLVQIRAVTRNLAAGDAYDEQKRSTQLEWVNFVARVHHGGEADTEGKPSSNVDPVRVRKQGLLDITQKQFLPSRHGILEIGLSMRRDRTDDDLRVLDWRLVSLELRGVHPNAKAALRKMGTVGDVKINKIVRVFLPQELNPPEPEIAVLVTADGVIRGGGNAYSCPGVNIEAAVKTAQQMSMSRLR